MWNYEKRLQFPVKIKETNPKLAQVIISQFGGPDGELAASMRYLSQRYAMPYRDVAGLLTDIGTEELAHLEMIGAMIYQLTKELSMEEIEQSGFDKYYVDHTLGIWPQAAGGIPFNACEFQSKGDIITDLQENMAAEQKARSTYDNILRLVKDPDVCEPIRFLREREIVHFQRFGEALRLTTERLDAKNFYAFNPGFDKCENCSSKP
ncbi:MAG: manganese catalase family protein [Lachnospiraceae bacterium]|nr:manganese catalase family protein [Lachnospiraceae bacterium]